MMSKGHHFSKNVLVHVLTRVNSKLGTQGSVLIFNQELTNRMSDKQMSLTF